ncbi:unnamed protein product [Caenorhabditis nigoni]|uniref:General transcription factor IIH subunit n=1 Tax=Caenorhabditis nigoni TaxID=1611254 RepID=A0A2G5UGQ5_9PELO|nr:hypothetical protein B9Z55_010630 [Caenorhabditis nigoni]
MDDDEQKGYTWEAGYAEGLNINEVLVEDEGGSIEKSIAKYVADSKRKARLTKRPEKIRLGIMRHVMIVIDCSRFMTSKAMPPSRFVVVMKALQQFLERFFEQNPIAQIGLITCKDRKADRLTMMTGNIRILKESLNSLTEAFCGGDFSLQNALQLACVNLKGMPGHVSREVVIVMAALSSIDPGNIFSTIETMKRMNIRCSAIGLSAEMFICKEMAKATKGEYSVALDPDHLHLLFSKHTLPPSSAKSSECNAIHVGFPHHELIKTRSFCVCHPDSKPISSRGFICTQCGARHCSIPAECPVCKLTLVAAPQLARAFRHLQPLAAFKQIEVTRGISRSCYACETRLSDEGFRCEKCRLVFCLDCDTLLHESLHVCPGCN